MRLADTPEEAAFRAEVREFLRKELPAELRRAPSDILQGELAGGGIEVNGKLEPRPGGVGFRPLSGGEAEWRRKLTERGWVAPSWPKEYGGAGLTLTEQLILNEEFAEAGAPQMTGDMGISMVGPTLILFGSEEQKAEHLPKILRGETLWCQGFSEPGSGSDLASLQTRAVRDGDDYIINGQKIWTSGAHLADWCILLARTDTEAPKHKGISYFLLDMKTPGITVQPLIDMMDNHGFNEMFFENVRIPKNCLLGQENQGWYMAATTLDFERSSIGGAVGGRRMLEEIVGFARETKRNGKRLIDEVPVRVRLADAALEVEIGQLLSYRVASMQSRGLVPNYESSIAKLFNTDMQLRLAKAGMEIMGLYGQLEPQSKYVPLRGKFERQYLWQTGMSVGGGTPEIQRNIIAMRGLGLPRQ